MKNMIAVSNTIVSISILSACVSLTPPQRPAYTGSDTVDSAQAAQLIGTWEVTDLNPFPDTEPQSTTIEYRADGTVTGTVIPQGKTADELGNLQFELDGEWTLNGDTVVHHNVSMNSTSDSPMGDLISKMINNREAISGRANIYELSTDRIVMVGDDGSAMEYTRH